MIEYRLKEIPVESIEKSIQMLYTTIGLDKEICLYITLSQLRMIQKQHKYLFDEVSFTILGYNVELLTDDIIQDNV